MAELTAAAPVLVHFFDFAQLNSVRTLPYLLEWERRYAGAGLALLGVQAPRFPFGADPRVAGRALERLGVEFPVAIDADREVWLEYGCEGWPSLFLWGRGGTLRWFHFGEGEYLATETAIQDELRLIDAIREFPAPMEPLRATDAPGALVMPPTPEHFPGEEGKAWVPPGEGEPLSMPYEAGGAYATLEGTGEVRVEIDGGEPTLVRVDGPGLYELASHSRHEAHSLRLAPGPGVGVWSVSFAAGVP